MALKNVWGIVDYPTGVDALVLRPLDRQRVVTSEEKEQISAKVKTKAKDIIDPEAFNVLKQSQNETYFQLIQTLLAVHGFDQS